VCHCCDVASTSTTTSDEPTVDVTQQHDSSVTGAVSADSFEHSYVSAVIISLMLMSCVMWIH